MQYFFNFFLKNNVVTDNTIPAAKNKIVNLQSNETSTIKAPKNWKTQNKIVGIIDVTPSVTIFISLVRRLINSPL